MDGNGWIEEAPDSRIVSLSSSGRTRQNDIGGAMRVLNEGEFTEIHLNNKETEEKQDNEI